MDSTRSILNFKPRHLQKEDQFTYQRHRENDFSSRFEIRRLVSLFQNTYNSKLVPDRSKAKWKYERSLDILLRDWQNAFVYDSPNRLLNNHHCCYEYIWHDIGTCIFQIYLRVVATHVSGLTCTRASRWLGHEASTSRVLVITISGLSPVFTNGNHFLVRYLTKMYLLIDEIDR